jgi:neurofibromin 1
LSICDITTGSDLDEISMLLFRTFEAKGNLLSLMKVLIEKEVQQTNHESELFRANSITTRLLTLFAKTYGYNYVRNTLQPLITNLAEKPPECSFELDPTKAGPGEDLERNTEHLRIITQALLDLIYSSTPNVPILFRALCHHIWEVVEERFPDSRHSAVGSFVFLRFFCPAIVAPEGIDMDVSPDTRDTRRALLLVTKIIQNLANNVLFGNKEAHMKVLNQFLSENIRQVTKFLSDVAVRPRSWEVSQATKAFQEEGERNLDADFCNATIQRFVFKHIGRLETALDAMPPTFRARSQSSTRSLRLDLDGKAALTMLRQIMEDTGTPADTVRLSSSARSQVYDDFMRHNAGRNTESVANAFYEGPASQNGRRIFYFIIARVALVDYDLLAYHVFAVLDKVTDFFDLIIDLTDFSSMTEMPSPWLRRSVQMCPPGILPLINTLVLYNPNSYARKRLRRIINDLLAVGPSVGKSVVAASSPGELADLIPYTTLALPDHTMALAFDAEHVFTNLLCITDHEMQVPVVVKLGSDCIQVATWRKQDVTQTLKAYIIDIIRLKDVDDVVLGSGVSSDRLTIKHSQNQSVTFISRSEFLRLRILQSNTKQSVSRWPK